MNKTTFIIVSIFIILFIISVVGIGMFMATVNLMGGCV